MCIRDSFYTEWEFKTINQKIDKNDDERRQEIAETNRRLEGIDAVVTLNVKFLLKKNPYFCFFFTVSKN